MADAVDAVALRLGVERMPVSIEERIVAACNAGAHRMSMLQDLELGRPLELEVLIDSLAAMRTLAGLATPTLDAAAAPIPGTTAQGIIMSDGRICNPRWGC